MRCPPVALSSVLERWNREMVSESAWETETDLTGREIRDHPTSPLLPPSPLTHRLCSLSRATRLYSQSVQSATRSMTQERQRPTSLSFTRSSQTDRHTVAALALSLARSPLSRNVSRSLLAATGRSTQARLHCNRCNAHQQHVTPQEATTSRASPVQQTRPESDPV